MHSVIMDSRNYIFIALLAAAGQGRMAVDRGKISFVSDAQLESIKAVSDKLSGEPATNRFAFMVPIASFRGFNNELQREHFYEKYLILIFTDKSRPASLNAGS